MRGSLILVGTLLLALGCGDAGGLILVDKPVNPSDVLLPSELCADNPDNAIVTFEDANLLAVVRSDLGLASLNDLTCNLISGVTTIDARSSEIASLVGIQNFPNLTTLRLNNNTVTNLNPLRGLVVLADLFLDDNTDLINIQPLLDNTGLGAGDNVSLTNTGVLCVDVATLRATGVTVSSECQ